MNIKMSEAEQRIVSALEDLYRKSGHGPFYAQFDQFCTEVAMHFPLNEDDEIDGDTIMEAWKAMKEEAWFRAALPTVKS